MPKKYIMIIIFGTMAIVGVNVAHTKSKDADIVKCFQESYVKFISLPETEDHEKNIYNYQISFRKENDVMIVLYQAKRDADELNMKGGRSRNGRDVAIYISLLNYEVLKYNYQK